MLMKTNAAKAQSQHGRRQIWTSQIAALDSANDQEMVIDLFAGGGGASEGIADAIQRDPDVAINHDADAIGMHQANHPNTRHYLSDVWEVDPVEVCAGRMVGLLHASPDCTHHSQAKGGQPRSQAIRSLAWVVHRWAGKAKPKLITLENVEQMMQWSPLVAKRDPETGRVVTMERIEAGTSGLHTHGGYRVADKGEYVPRHNQFLVPDKKRLGRNWTHFVEGLRDMGYVVQWRVIVNADLGAHSTRQRLYLVARRDGQPIVWPEQSHAKRKSKALRANPSLQTWRPAHECIDWSQRGNSIFGRDRDLKPPTLRRTALGIKRFVLDAEAPFVVATPAPARPGESSNGSAAALVAVTHSRDAAYSVHEPLRTITTAKGGETAVAMPTLIQVSYGEREGQAPRVLDLKEPLGTVVAGGIKHAVAEAIVAPCLIQAGHGEGKDGKARHSYGCNDVQGPIGTITASGGGQSVAMAFMVQANGGFNATPVRDLQAPMSTVTTTGSQQQLVAAHLMTLRHHSVGRDLNEPISTVAAGGEHHALMAYALAQEIGLSPEETVGAIRCANFILDNHPDGAQMREGMKTPQDLLELVTVRSGGKTTMIVDITLRMLLPRELYNAQDFRPDYIIDRTAEGKPLTKTAQVRMCGNSVSPLPMSKIISANCGWLCADRTGGAEAEAAAQRRVA